MFSFFPIETEAHTKKNVKKEPSCFSCTYKNCICYQEAEGKGNKRILIIIPKPHSDTEILGGTIKRELSMQLRRHGIDLYEDCHVVSSVSAYSKSPTDPIDQDIFNCRKRVLDIIKECNPKLILAIGTASMKLIAQNRSNWSGAGFPNINQFRGYVIPDQFMGCYVAPLFDPSYIVKQKQALAEISLKFFYKDLIEALRYLDEPFNQVNHLEHIDIPCSEKKACIRLHSALDYIKEHKCLISFDYETTGIKPHQTGHKIVSCAISYKEDDIIKTVSVRWTPHTSIIINELLKDPTIPKTGHNMGFEEAWTRTLSNMGVANWDFDTILAAHVLDNRIGVKSLKFQSYVHLGILGYEDDIQAYIKSDGDNDNAFNKMDQAPTHTLLLYNGLDAYCGLNLAYIYKEKLTDLNLWDGYNILHEGVLALSEAEANGLLIDIDYCKNKVIEIKKEIQDLKDKIQTYPEIIKWKQKMGDEFNLRSNKQLTELIYDQIGIEVKTFTPSGNASVSRSTLEEIEIPFVKDLIAIRKKEKIKTTYIEAILKEQVNGVLRPFFPLYKIVTYRSSSTSINFQNIPKRDPVAQQLVRTAFLPEKDHLMCEVDYSGIEVKISTTYHKDKNMIKYLCDDTTDMHRDTAADLFMLKPEDVTKQLRQVAKGFVFSQFYGDWYVSGAKLIWDTCITQPMYVLNNGIHIKDWLAQHGITRLGEREIDDGDESAYLHLCKRVEDIMWKKRFPQYAQWRIDHWEAYKKNLEFRGHTGFRYTGVMSRNDVTNYGTQGSAFHCLLKSFTSLTKWIKQNELKSKILGQIHDAIVLSIHKDEVNLIIPMLRKIMIDDLVDKWKWINVPLDVEIDLAPINSSWYSVKTVDKRTIPCSCGIEYGYKNKEEGTWKCPVCGKVK